jgi:hypothetical protein
MSSLAVRTLKWAGRKATGTVTTAAKDRARRAKCKAEPKGRGRVCNKSLRTGRLADGMSCGSELCQLWWLAKDEKATAHYLGLTTAELADQIAAARAA